ncbi:MAG: NUDIX hydrolase [Candidatus Omnitrophota bacterium]
MSRPWEKKSSRYVAHYRIFHLREDICVSPRNGVELPAYVLETRDWINIIPLTPDREVVMVHQYRFGTEEMSLEIPGGLADPSDGSMLEAARRELREETGYDSEEVIPLGAVRPNPAILNNTCHLFLAKNVILKYDQSLDDGEDIRVELVPLAKIPQLIQEGKIVHSLVLNAFYLFDLLRAGR